MHHKIIKFAVMTIEQIHKHYTDQLKNIYEERESFNIADWVFESIAGIKRLDRNINKQQQLNNSTVEQLNNKLQELLQYTPVQYVLGEAWFYKMKFFVNENVLIPRPETEELIEWIVSEAKSKNDKLRIIDIGTGSGCIAIVLKKEVPYAEVLAIDISGDALSVATQNSLQFCTNVEFLQRNFLDEPEWYQLPSFDVIVSNPPYISEKEKSDLAKNVFQYEPHLALFPPDPDHLIFYKKIALFAKSHLSKKGKIYVEVNEKYANEVSEIFNQHKFSSTIKKDIYGRNRMIKAH